MANKVKGITCGQAVMYHVDLAVKLMRRAGGYWYCSVKGREMISNMAAANILLRCARGVVKDTAANLYPKERL